MLQILDNRCFLPLMSPAKLLCLKWLLIAGGLFSIPAKALMIAQIESSSDQILGGLILTEIYKRAEIPLELVPLPGARAILSSSSGQLDGEQMRIYKVGELYPDLVRIPTPFVYFEPAAFSYRNDIVISGWDSLTPYYTGRVRGIKFAEIGLNTHPQTLVLDSNQLLFNLLNHQRIEIAVTTKFSGQYQVNLLNLSQIYLLQPPLEKHHLYHYLHKSHRHLVPKLDHVIRAMRDSGELERLRNQFYLGLLKEAKSKQAKGNESDL